MNQFFYFFILYLITLGIIWITGGTIMVPFMQKKDYKSLKFNFFRMLSGILALTLISSLYFTGGKSIFWLLGIIPVIMLLQNKGKFSLSIARNISYWVPNCYFLLLIPVPFFIQYLNFGPINSFIPFDIIDYVTVSEFNAIHGRENIFGTLNAFSTVQTASHSPYHYAELWLNQLFSRLYDTNPGKNLLYITYSTLFLTVLSGFISLFEQKGIKKIWLPLIVAAVFFGGPIYWSGVAEWFGNVRYLGGSFIIFENFGFFGNTVLSAHHAQKHLYFAALFIAVLSLKNNKLLSLSLIAIFPVINIGLTLGVFSFGVAFFIFSLFRKSFSLLEISVLALPSTLMIVFYALSGMAPSDISYPQVLYTGAEEISVKGEIIRAVMRVTHAILFVAIAFSPLLLSFLIARKETKSTDVNLPVFFVTTSLIVPFLSRPFLIGFDSAQFLTYLLPAFTIFLLFVILKFIINNKNRIWERAVTLTILLVLISLNAHYLIENNRSKNKVYEDIYSDEYVKNVKHAFSKPEQVRKIGYILSEELLHANMPSNWKHQKVGSLAAENNRWGIVSLNFPLIAHDFKSWSNESFHNHQQFFWDSDSVEKFHDRHLTNFIIENSISHVFIGTGLSPEWIDYFETEEILDTKSGERLVVIKGMKNVS